MRTVQEYKNVISKLPHSDSRVPYTYHHYFIRMNSEMHNAKSRSDVAHLKVFTDEELYATALVEIITECGGLAVVDALNQQDLYIARDAVKVCDAALKVLDEINPKDPW